MPDDLESLRSLPPLDVESEVARRIERRLDEGASSSNAALPALLASTALIYLAWAIAFTAALGPLPH